MLLASELSAGFPTNLLTERDVQVLTEGLRNGASPHVRRQHLPPRRRDIASQV